MQQHIGQLGAYCVAPTFPLNPADDVVRACQALNAAIDLAVRQGWSVQVAAENPEWQAGKDQPWAVHVAVTLNRKVGP